MFQMAEFWKLLFIMSLFGVLSSKVSAEADICWKLEKLKVWP